MKYSEEEKKAIETCKTLIKENRDNENHFLNELMYEEAESFGITADDLEIVLNLIEKQQNEIENIKKEVQEHIAFENRLKRDNTEPDLFNQGRFYVANNIKDILDGKEII